MDPGSQSPPPFHKGNSDNANRSLSDIQEEMSLNYVTGVCAMAGYTADITNRDVNKVDLNVTGVVKGVQALVRLQLKSTYQHDPKRDDIFRYRLQDDELRKILGESKGHPNPFVLVVLHLPDNHSHWFTVSPSQAVLRHCAYWMCAEAIDGDTQTLHIPRRHLFNVGSIRKLMTIAADRVRDAQLRWQDSQQKGSS